jgi:lactoylglutathione lyase
MQTSFGHMAIRVRDIEAAAKYYADYFGFKEIFRMTEEDGSAGLIAVQIKDRQFMELMRAGEEEQDQTGGVGFLHICFETGDVEKLYADLTAKGIYADAAPRVGKSGSKFFFTRDLDGNSIEFVQILPGSLQDQAFRKFAGAV